MDPALAQSFLHGEHTCCGVALAPFTLRHAFALEAIGSPCALVRGQNITAGNIFVAALICSTRNEKELHEMIRAIREQTIAVAITSTAEEAFTCWNAYLADYVRCPELLPLAGSGREVQLHWILYTAARLMRKGGFTPAQAWWTPVGEARWYSLAFSEIDGDEFLLADSALKDRLRRMGHNV